MLAQVVFVSRGEGYWEVQYLDEVEGEYYVGGGFACPSSKSLRECIEDWGRMHHLAGVSWEVRDEDWRLEMLGRFDGRG
ncbi:hypothetical protein JW921_05965 [Candidatus Fermentibacterales bacterium]|nr:hypothetical protein [Candidatus Fermentibacterales bacterium]